MQTEGGYYVCECGLMFAELRDKESHAKECDKVFKGYRFQKKETSALRQTRK